MRNNPDFDVNDPAIGLVHRIDKDTSGLLVIAKTAEVKSSLGKQFFDHSTRREYVAVIWGHMDPADGVLRSNLARDLRDRTRMAAFPYEEIASPAIRNLWRMPLLSARGRRCMLRHWASFTPYSSDRWTSRVHYRPT